MTFRPKSDELTPGTPVAAVPSLGPVARDSRHIRHLEFLGMKAIVASRAMQRVLEKAEKVARTDSTVLIAGESGVGKELVARAIHHFSPRKERPFVDLNCAAFPENLIESELFGYEKGAFSGAEGVKQGLFETASAGTIFLDEIGELETRMQAKLLRVLDGQSYYRLGGSRKVQPAARVLAATNSNLQESVKRGWFRDDLFHRLDAIQLRVPPLRERVDDIAPLCEHFLGGSGCFLREDALEILQRYSWPGNVRELRNVLNKAMVFADQKELTPEDLPPGLHSGAIEQSGYSLERLEEQAIFLALDQTGGHQQKAAEILGISRRTLIRKLKQYGPAKTHGRGDAHRHSGDSVDSGMKRPGPGFTL